MHPLRVVVLLLIPSWLLAAEPGDVDHFEKKVRPLLLDRCVRCHGAEKAKAGLRLDVADVLRRTTKAGPIVRAGKPDESLLIKAVRRTGELKMPPDEPLSERQVRDLTTWVSRGAVWPKGSGGTSGPTFTAEQKAFWSFQPIADVKPPAVAHSERLQSPLDAFIFARLEKAGLSPSAPAGRETLLRRVTFDLAGRPPTPDEVESVRADRSPDWYERVVDRLLASPDLGERWGRHWLDIVRYAETTANDANAVLRYAWRYRDYVVGAINRDLPYDRFLIEQLAGDLLPDSDDARGKHDRVVATGFLMIGPKALAETDKEQSRLDVVDDQLDVVGRAFLGLTIACARCHDHKFDPIPTLDYYSLAGILRSTEAFRDDVRNASMWQEWELSSGPGGKPVVVMAPKEGKPADLKVHLRGNRHRLGAVAPRRMPSIIAGENQTPLGTAQSGRLELARWIASKDNPLTARVAVNRLWQHHFGVGLVATSDNFGVRGERPSHPELLDWLAARFIESGWSQKAMHRLIVLSDTYRMSSRPNEDGMRLDPGNRLLWRMPRRRLEAEAMRDAMLAVAGRLDRAMGGGDSGELLFREGEVIDAKRDFFRPNRLKADHPIYTDSTRRSIYLPVVRNAMPDVLSLFDAADPNGVTPGRNDTTVPAQALYLLNHSFVRDQAMYFARRLLGGANEDDSTRINRAVVLALGRPAREIETRDVLDFLGRFQKLSMSKGRSADEARLAAWKSYCQILLTRNEFLYVD